jgi:hypothetical protein
VLVILCVPEVVILIKYFPDGLTISDLIASSCYGISIVVILYSVLYLKLREKNVTRVLLALIISWVLIILFSVPLLLMAIINFSVAAVLYYSLYYRFEYDLELE